MLYAGELGKSRQSSLPVEDHVAVAKGEEFTDLIPFPCLTTSFNALLTLELHAQLHAHLLRAPAPTGQKVRHRPQFEKNRKS